MPKILIAGATGLVGGYLLGQLLETPSFEAITALLRRPLASADPRLLQCLVDFDHLDQITLEPVDTVFCCLGSTMRTAGSQAAFRKVDHDYPVQIAERARAAGARQYLLVSSVGADAHSSNFYLRTKGEVEHDLAALGFASLQIFHPSLLLGDRQEFRRGEGLGQAVAQALQWTLIGGLRKYRPVPAATVARAMRNAALLAPPGTHVYHFDEIQELATTPGT